MMARARQLPGQTPPSTRCSASWPAATSRSPRAATRCGAAARCGCRRRPRPSPATCPRRWDSPSPRPRPPPGGRHRPARRRDRALLLRRRVAPTTRPRSSAINTARYARPRGLPMPILFVCEDNGIGISCRPPRAGSRPPSATSNTCATSAPTARSTRCGTRSPRRSTSCAAPGAPRSCTWPPCACGATRAATSRRRTGRREIEANESRDPLLRNARRLVETGAATPDAAAGDRGRDARARDGRRRGGARRPRLETTRGGDRARWRPTTPAAWRPRAADPAARRRRRASSCTAAACPRRSVLPNARTLGRQPQRRARRRAGPAAGGDPLRRGRRPEGRRLRRDERACRSASGSARVFDTLLDETSILGIAQGAAHDRPAARSRRSSTSPTSTTRSTRSAARPARSRSSSGQFRNPMVVRVPGLAYQKGFGGHFHNDNSIGALRDIPGLVLAVPGARRRRGAHAARRGRDGAPRTAGWSSSSSRSRSTTRRTCDDRRRRRLADRLPAAAGRRCLPGEVGIYGPPTRRRRPADRQLRQRPAPLAARGAAAASASTGSRARVLDLRWLNPLPIEAIREQAADMRRRAGRRRVPAHRRRGRRRDRRRPGRGGDRRAASGRCARPTATCRSAPPRSAVLVGDRSDRRRGADHGERAAAPVTQRAVLACPGRGSYTAASLGSLKAEHPWVVRAEQLRAGYGLEPLLELDRAERFDPARHLQPIHASPLIFLVSMLDAETAAADYRITAAIGNSMGWYTALAVAGALSFEDALPAGAGDGDPPAGAAPQRGPRRAGDLPAGRRRLAPRPGAARGRGRRARRAGRQRRRPRPREHRPGRLRGPGRGRGGRRPPARPPGAGARRRADLPVPPLAARAVPHAAGGPRRRGGRRATRRPRLARTLRHADRRPRRALDAVVDRPRRAARLHAGRAGHDALPLRASACASRSARTRPTSCCCPARATRSAASAGSWWSAEGYRGIRSREAFEAVQRSEAPVVLSMHR